MKGISGKEAQSSNRSLRTATELGQGASDWGIEAPFTSIADDPWAIVWSTRLQVCVARFFRRPALRARVE